MDIRNGLPADFLARLESIIEPRFFSVVLESFANEKRAGVRVNTLKTDSDAIGAELKVAGISPQPVDWLPEALLVDPDQRHVLTRLPLATGGLIYVQGLSSMLSVDVLDPRPDQSILDLAAAPGGKATHIAQRMQNRGRLSVVEPIRPRMYRLADNLKRCGVTIGKTYLLDGRAVGRKTPNRFDRVMLDAPCSSEARFRCDQSDTWKYWSLRKISEQSRKQKGLLISAFQALRPGGTLLYCTCSFAPEENEQVVQRLLQEYPDRAELLSIFLPFDNWQPGLTSYENLGGHDDLQLCRRILPDDNMEAFFLAKITKRA